MGVFGTHLAAGLQRLGNEVLVIDKNPQRIEEISVDFDNAYTGDCTNPNILKSIGVNNFDRCVVAIGEDFYASIEILTLLKEMGARYVISKAKMERQASILTKLGADEVVYPERDMADRLAMRYHAGSITEYYMLQGGMALFELPVPEKWVEHSIGDLDIRKRYQVTVVAIKRGEAMLPNPGPAQVLEAGDVLVTLGDSEQVARLRF